ncbi:hypothetical protein GUITHDRAFT_112792 [Guillardia theta CCMP2712]|uniref:Peptidase C14 caspase domain-containing protein n=1 Tax=Guillardia theta (strain CCMP2712) TaxID=905079 RepID=L1IXU1_GUITC|nr:hypothetical protein GUITHDRAFT_112792 [Guillardia theta CCMP2712]EKX41056.1 hypothetical protein GUITHDRAFT_112792 [Guillardia theta CCMP2712]|eukprot:XP_005828036.1 hypothetical protein GUITHDRAFT_112792 [Guillardia theta CCMP2712]
MLNLDVQNTADLGRFLRSGFKDLSRDSPQQVILFYAGHGAQLPTGEVYMIPGDCSNDDLSSLGSIDICALSISSALRFWSEAFKKDSKARLLIIFDACRKIIENFPVKAGYNVEQPSKPTEDIQLKQWALYMTCPSGSKTFDDSEFMKYLMHDIKGVFGINNELKEVLDHAANHCENVSEFNRYKIATPLWKKTFQIKNYPGFKQLRQQEKLQRRL